MNDQQLEKKVRRDVIRVRKDFNTLIEHSADRLGRLGDNVNQVSGKAKDDLTTWVQESNSQFNKGFDKLTGDAKKTVVSTATSLKKDVGHGLRQYNAKAQEVADSVPGAFAKNVSQYPWVAISLGLVVGMLMGGILKPARHFVN